MRRIICLLLAFALTIGVFSVNTLPLGAVALGYALNGATFLPGDIDLNGKVDLTDVVALAQYVAGWDIDCCIAALDPNGDTYSDLEDVVCLAKYVADWHGFGLSDKEYVPEGKDDNDGDYYTETLRVYNSEAPITDEYRGMSGSIYHAFGYMNDDKYGRVYTNAQRKIELDRLDDSGVRFARTNYTTKWMWDGAYGGYNWNSTRINGFWDYCKNLGSRDISVVLQVGWHLGTFTKMESYSIAEADYITDLLYGDIYGETSGYDFSQCEDYNYRQMAKRSLRMGENLAQLILQARARGINNISHFSYFVEPSYPTIGLSSNDPAYGYEGAFADEYIFIVQTIQQKLKDKGVYNLVKHVGPNQGPVQHGDGLMRYILDRGLTNMFDVWTSHFYPLANYSAENVYFDATDPVFEAYMQTIKNAGIYGDVEFWVDDFYCRDVNTNSGMNNAWAGLQNTVCAIAAQQRGINNLSLWAIFDQLWIDKTNTGGAFEGGIHICGSAPSLFVSDIPKMQYYTTGLFSKYNGYKNGKAYRTNNYDLHYYSFGDLSIGAVLLEDGSWTITVVNAYYEPYKITVKFDKAINQNLYKHSQTVENITPTPEADLANAQELFRNVKTQFTDVVEPESINIYTGLRF